MYSASDLRKGLRVEIDGAPYIITEFNFVKPGKGQAIYNCRLKNLVNGSTMSKSYRSNDQIDQPHIEERQLVFSYDDGHHFVFMDENYEQVLIESEILGDSRYYLEPDIQVSVLFHNGKAIGVTFPTFIEKTIVETEPGARGNTATNVLKPATVEGGYVVQVPLFVNQGDIIKIDTRDGTYADRVSKK